MVKKILVGLLLIFYGITRYFHSFYSGAQGYGSGDAYKVILNAYTAGNNFDIYLISYFYKLAHEISGISYYQISFFTTPLIGLFIVLIIFDILRREFGFVTAYLSSLLIIINPWLAYYSTEPSKEIFVLFFFLLSFYFLYRFEKSRQVLWLVISCITFAVGIIYYHSILLFFPFYFVVFIFFVYRVFKINRPIYHIFLSFSIFAAVIFVIAGPLYVIKEINYKTALSQKPIFLKTDVDNQGNTFQRQFGAMYYALTKDQQKLGVNKLIEGSDNFILKQHEFIFLFVFILFSSLYFLKKQNKYIPLLFSILTLYIFAIIGLQWTSYSHTSRYPQYIVYFLLLCASLPLGLSLQLLHYKKVQILIMTFFIVLSLLLFDPFLRVDGFRDIYYPHLMIGAKAKQSKIKIDKNNQVLYLGWPSITLSLLENYNLKNEEYLNTFGWELVDLDGVSSEEYIKKKQIAYFIYNEGGSDYFDSNNKVFTNLKKNFSLTPISYVTKDKQSIVIYQIKYL